MIRSGPRDACVVVPETPDGLGVAVRALDAGYAVAYEGTRGRGDSEGSFEPWRHEATDGATTVGMYGGSSPGQVQVLAALEDPDGLAAIAPMFAPSDLHRADFFQDGAMNAQAMLTWSFDAVAADTVDRLRDAGRLDDRRRRRPTTPSRRRRPSPARSART